jgi:ribose transport system permease protein
MSAVPAGRPQQSGAHAAWRRLVHLQKRFPLLQVVALIAVYIYGYRSLPGLGTWAAIKTILVFASLIGLAAAGQTLLILMGGFDLSVAGIIVASGLMITTVKVKYGWSAGEAVVITVAAAGVLGAIAGQVCHRFKIQPLIVTLGTGAIAIGLVQAQDNGLTSGSAPTWLHTLASPATHAFGVDIPPMVLIWIAVAVLMAVFLHRTPAGRRLMATGANPRAAEYSLINTRRIWTVVFAFSAMASSLVGLLVAGFDGTVDGTVGDPYLFGSVVAVLVGGTVFGGPGDYTRTVLGALFLEVVNIVLVGHGATQADEYIVEGIAIIVAVTLYGRQRGLRDTI